MDTAPPRSPRAAPDAQRTVPDTSERMCRLRSPFPDLRRHLKFDGMQKPRSPAVRKHEQPVVRARFRRPFLFPGLGVAKKVDLAQAVRVAVLRGEVDEELERRARVELAVVTRFQQEQPAVMDGAENGSRPRVP